jgi:hypothetical protein
MQLLSGADLDRRIAQLLQGEDVKPAPYSTSPVASQRLVRSLSENLGLTCAVEHDQGLVYCRLKRGGATVATGSAETAEMAIARATANLSPFTLGPTVRPSSKVRETPTDPMRPKRRRGSRPATVPCELCGAPMKAPPVASPRQLCNPCSYRILMETARQRERADR